MKKFLVVKSCLPTAGRGVNGRTLYAFLKTYAGQRDVQCCDVDDLENSAGISAEHVFLGLPSNITAGQLARLRYRHLVLFDLTDHHDLMWDDATQPLLRNETNTYLKAWCDERWDYPLRMGVLPIRRHGRLRAAIDLERVRRFLGGKARQRKYDIMFLGGPTGTRRLSGEAMPVSNQRVEWLLELKRRGAHLKLWGGMVNHNVHPGLAKQYGDLSEIFIQNKRTSFWKYYQAMQQSAVALTPEGVAPWTYRHYEAIYAGALVVTSDFRRIRMLVPLPVDNMVHVESGQPLLPAVERALALRREHPELPEENIRFLERHLHHGMYSRKRPELFERFLAQLPGYAA